MLQSSTDDSPLAQNAEDVKTDATEEQPSEQTSVSFAEDEVSGFAEPPIVTTE